VEKAYKLFRELNKHAMYLTVVRLYYKYGIDDKLRQFGNSDATAL